MESSVKNQRCPWCIKNPVYTRYHDEEWGVPVYDSRDLWEKFVLDGFQAGLSWITILNKRENFKKAFYNFDPERVAGMTSDDVERLMLDEGIIRNRSKITATIQGAQIWLAMENAKQNSFRDLIWDTVNHKPIQNRWVSMTDVPTQTPDSERLSKDLKRSGFKFCGPVIVYAFMQAVGLVNDHLIDCFRYKEIKNLQFPSHRSQIG
jgi:DNA-3-methyladenine glycosylase I